MIAIKDIASGEYFDLMPGQKIPIEWESPLMKDDVVLSGIGSLPFPLPFTDKNKRLCKHFELVNSADKNVVLDVDLELMGNFWARGKLVVAVKSTSYDCDFSETLGIINIGDKKLSDLLKDDVHRIIGTYKRVWHIKLSNTSALFQLRISSFYFHYSTSMSTIADSTSQLYDFMVADTDFLRFFAVTIETIGSETIINLELYNDDTVLINPILFFACMDIVFDTTEYGTVIDWAAHQIDEVCNVIDGDVSNVYNDVPYCFPMIKNDIFYSTYNAQYTSVGKVINHYKLGYSNNKNSSSAFKRSISPQFFLFYVLEKIVNQLGITIDGDFTEIEQIKNRCFIYNNFAIDLWMNNEAHNNGGTDIWNTFSSKVFTKNHMPDITFAELLRVLKAVFCITCTVKNNILYFNINKNLLSDSSISDLTIKSFKYLEEYKGCFEDGFKLKYELDSSDNYLSEHVKDIVFNRKQDVATYNDLPQVDVAKDEIRLVIDQQKFYRAKISDFPVPINWVYWSHNLGDYKYLNGINEIDTKESPTINDYLIEELTSTTSRKVYIPHIYQTGSSPLSELGFNPASTRLLFYWGKKVGEISEGETTDEHTLIRSHSFVTGTPGDVSEYPLASIDNFDMDGNQLGDYALRFDGPYGLFENFYKEWLDFRNQSKPFTIKVLLPVNEILQLNILKKVRIKESVFFIDRIKTEIGQNDTELVCIIDLYKV